MSAAEIANKGAAESAADRAYQEQMLESSKNRPRGPHPMLRQVWTVLQPCLARNGDVGALFWVQWGPLMGIEAMVWQPRFAQNGFHA
jgi:hypothetical protein